MKEEGEGAKEFGLPTIYNYNYAMKGREYLNASFLMPLIPNSSTGWDGKIDQREATVTTGEATFHPAQYMAGHKCLARCFHDCPVVDNLSAFMFNSNMNHLKIAIVGIAVLRLREVAVRGRLRVMPCQGLGWRRTVAKT